MYIYVWNYDHLTYLSYLQFTIQALVTYHDEKTRITSYSIGTE